MNALLLTIVTGVAAGRTTTTTMRALLLTIVTGVAAARTASTPGSTPDVGRAWLTPAPMVGTCNASCTSNKAFPCIYTPYYPVWFHENGTFAWRAPWANGSSVEHGHGALISEVNERRFLNGSWTARWYGANSYEPDLTDTTHCACYYVVGEGIGRPFQLHNYRVKEAPNTSQLPLNQVCGRYLTECPTSIVEAYDQFGSPWIESYMGCLQP